MCKMHIIRLLFQRPIKTRLVTRVACRARRLDEREQTVGIAVVAQLLELLDVATGLALVPEFLAAARPEPRRALLERETHRFGVHPRHHEHVFGHRVLHDARDEALVVVHELFGIHGNPSSGIWPSGVWPEMTTLNLLLKPYRNALRAHVFLHLANRELAVVEDARG